MKCYCMIISCGSFAFLSVSCLDLRFGGLRPVTTVHGLQFFMEGALFLFSDVTFENPIQFSWLYSISFLFPSLASCKVHLFTILLQGACLSVG